MSTEALFGREIEDDHDLLTYNESGARLREEIGKMQDLVAVLKARPDADAAHLARLESATVRLAGLQESAERNSRAAANDENAAGFLRYSGPGSTLVE